MEKQNQNF